jgi:WD40 repeat protein
VRWKKEAEEILSNLPSKVVIDVKKRVERYAQDSAKRDIYAPTVYMAKPPIKLLFPNAVNANYEKHLGPCVSISCSPFIKRLFLSCSSDGSIRLYDSANQRPIMVFEPGYNEYMMQVAWSPVRPTVFVALSNTGTVYIYDLILSKQTPSYILDYKPPNNYEAGSSKSAYAISFNPVIRGFLAIGYHDGTAKVF